MNLIDGEHDELSLESLVGFLLRRASLAFSVKFTESMREEPQITRAVFGTLALIHHDPGISQSDVARRLRIQRANMVPIISNLTKSGLVRREATQTDRRVFSLTLTAAGEAAFKTAWQQVSDGENALLASFSNVEKTLLVALLRKLDVEEDAPGGA